MADRMGCAVAYAASHSQLYLAAAGTDRSIWGGGGRGWKCKVGIGILAFATTRLWDFGFLICKTLPKCSLPAITF
jgi:hypothetical protein